MKALFTAAVHFEQNAHRYGHVIKSYSKLYHGLRKLGFDVNFYINSRAWHRSLKKIPYVSAREVAFDEYVEVLKPDVVFIWGGRRAEDQRTAAQARLANPAVKIIYSELGWFPQRDRIYFDDLGTNAAARISHSGGDRLFSADEYRAFQRIRRRIIRRDLRLRFYQRVPEFSIQKPDLSKPILVPLQDEADSNILYSSPFKRMRDFVSWLGETYPNHQFLVRAHPRAPARNLPAIGNVTYQAPGEPLFSAFNDIGMVLGINSTVLLQSALHNKTVVAVGEGIASFGGCVHRLDVNVPPPSLRDIEVSTEQAAKRLMFLLVERQIDQNLLSKPTFLRNSYLLDLIGAEK